MIAFLALILIVYALCPAEIQTAMGVADCRLWACLTYPLAHTSWLHLAINTLALSMMYPPVRNLYCCRYNGSAGHFFGVVYLSAVLAGLMAATTVPTLGASGMVFALLGMLLALNPTRRQVRNYLWVALAVGVQIYFGKSNVALHLVAFGLGAMAVVVRQAWKQLKIRDTE